LSQSFGPICALQGKIFSSHKNISAGYFSNEGFSDEEKDIPLF
jgi:hypothetical protein